MIRLDDLQFQGLKIYQDTEADRFSQDAVALANFLRVSPRDRVVDIGCGNGIVSILGCGKTGAAFVGVDRQAGQVALARQSAALNRQELLFYEMDLNEAPAFFGYGRFTAAAMNPPYFTAGDLAQSPSRALARHGDNLVAFIGCAEKLLKNGGKLFCCYPTGQLCTLMWHLRNNRLEPKRIALYAFDEKGAPKRVLIEAKKGGGPGLVFENFHEAMNF